MNLYAFVGNGPANFVDPDGLFWYYGCFGGSDWSDCTDKYGDEDKAHFPRRGEPGFKPPTDQRDEFYYEHDVCLNECAKDPCDENRQQCRTKCDNDLSKEEGTLPGAWPGTPYWDPTIDWEIWYFSSPYSYNKNPGKYHP